MPPRRSKRMRDGENAATSAGAAIPTDPDNNNTLPTDSSAATAAVRGSEETLPVAAASSSSSTSLAATNISIDTAHHLSTSLPIPNTTTTTTTTTATTQMHAASSSSSLLLAELLFQIRLLSESPSRCSSALRALMEGRTALNSNQNNNISAVTSISSAMTTTKSDDNADDATTKTAPSTAFSSTLPPPPLLSTTTTPASGTTAPSSNTTSTASATALLSTATSASAIQHSMTTTTTTTMKKKKVPKKPKEKKGTTASSAKSDKSGKRVSFKEIQSRKDIAAAAAAGVGNSRDRGKGNCGGGDDDTNDDDGGSSSNDAHLLLATTQAINTLLSHWKRITTITTTTPSTTITTTAAAADAAAENEMLDKKKSSRGEKTESVLVGDTTTNHDTNRKINNHKEEEEEVMEMKNRKEQRNIAILLISLSHPLMTCLVNDRSLLESITKANSNSSSNANNNISGSTGNATAARGAAVTTTAATATTTSSSSRFSFSSLEDTNDNEDIFGSTLAIGRGGVLSSSSSSSSSQQQQRTAMADGKTPVAAASPEDNNEDMKRRLSMSHAKAAVGRALSSGVMGALFGMEMLGKQETVLSMMNSGDVDDDVIINSDTNYSAWKDNAEIIVECAVLRKSLWTSLFTLEMAFQLSSRPKILSTSSVLSPTSGTLRNIVTGAASTSTSSSSSTSNNNNKNSNLSDNSDMDAVWRAILASSSPAISSSTRMAALMLSASSSNEKGGPNSSRGAASGGGDSSMAFSPSTTASTPSSSLCCSVGHAHLTMGSDTISMWNDLSSRIMAQYRIEFQPSPHQRHGRLFDSRTTGTPLDQLRHGSSHVRNDSVGGDATTESDYLVQVCREATDVVFVEEEADSMRLISLVLDVYTSKENQIRCGDDEDSGMLAEPPKKSSRTVSSTGASSGGKRGGGVGGVGSKPAPKEILRGTGNNYSELSFILSSRVENHISFDCYVSIRRWAVLAFGWLCSGQKRLLDMGAVMLSNAEVWEQVMDMMNSSVVGGITAGASDDNVPWKTSIGAPSLSLSKSTRKRKKRKENDKTQKNKLSFDSDIANPIEGSDGGVDRSSASVPGNLVLIIFVSAIIDMIYDAGVTGGMTPPSSGWMDEYIKAVVGGGGVVSAVDNAENLTESNLAPETTKSAPPAPTAVSAGVRRSSRQILKTTNSSTKTTIVPTTVATDSPLRAGSARASSSPRSRGASPSINKRVLFPSVWVRPDIRDETAVLTKYLIERHMITLSANFSSEKEKRRSFSGCFGHGVTLVNDDDSFFGLSASPSGKRRIPTTTGKATDIITLPTYFYPFMHRTLETLGRIVASSSNLASSSGSKSKIVALGSAVAMGLFSQIHDKERETGAAVALDAKLFSLAIFQLSECFVSVLSENGPDVSSSSAVPPLAIPSSVLQTYRLADPLVVTRNDPLVIAGAGSNTSSYGGAFLLDDTMLDASNSFADSEKQSFRGSAPISSDSLGRSDQADILSLYIRAQLSPEVYYDCGNSSSTTICDAAIASLLQCLLVVIGVSFNFSLEMHCQEAEKCIDAEMPLSKNKSTASRKKKRRAGDSVNSTLEMSGQKRAPSRKTYTRCVLASDAIDALVKAMVTVSPLATKNTAFAARSIQSHFRTQLSTNMVTDFVKLGYRLEESFLRPIIEVVTHDFDTLTTGTLCDSDLLSSIGGLSSGCLSKGRKNAMHVPNLLEIWEYHMWANHTLLSIMMGGCDGQMPSLDNPSHRLRIFRAVVDAEKEYSDREKNVGQELRARSSRKAKKARDSTDHWPLHLPSVQCSLISAMILFSSKSIAHESSGLDDISVDRQLQQVVDLHFLCMSFLNSVEAAVEDPSQLHRASSGMIIIEGNVAISLRDARLFSLATSKLPKVIQSRILSRFISIIRKGVHGGNLLVENNEMSHVIARGISLCSSLVALVSIPRLESLLAEEIEASLCYSLPRLVPNQNYSTAIENNQVESIMFRKDYFQSIFGDWQSPSVPIIGTACTSVLDGNITDQLVSVISSALTFGFETSATDDCHLLFSSWNAANNMSLWRSISWDGPTSATVMKSLSVVDRILRLREDICGLYHLMQSIETPSQVVNKTLFSGIDNAEESISLLTMELDKIECSAPTRVAFAYYEALPLYISFLISMHCCPGPNDMGFAHRLKISTLPALSAQGSKLLQQTLEEDGGNLLRMNALSRLHKACLALGAAPCYPDWLDASCKLRAQIPSFTALDSAKRALLALTSYGTKVWRSYFHSMGQVLSILDETGDVNMQDKEGAVPTTAYHVALHFFFVQQRHPSDLSDAFYSEVASLCQTNSSLFKLLVLSLSTQCRLAGSKFVTTSAQRIMGANFYKPRKVFKGEHRANGQWETLMAEVLQGSSLTFPLPTSFKTSGAMGSDDESTLTLKRIEDSLAVVHHWRRVLCSVIDAMVPATALMRFSINDGKGDRHTTLGEDLSSGTSALASEFWGAKKSSEKKLHNQEATASIKLSLSFLSFVAAFSSYDEDIRSTSRAAAGPLLESSSHFNDLVALWSVVNSSSAISRGIGILEDKEGVWTKSQKDSSCVMIRSTLNYFSDNAGSEIDEIGLPLNGDKIASFQACIGMKNMKPGRLVGNETDTDLLEVIAADFEMGLTQRGLMSSLISNENDVSVRFSADGALSSLLNLLCGKVPGLRGPVQIFVAEMLIQLMDIHDDASRERKKSLSEKSSSAVEVVRASVASLLNKFTTEDMTSLVRNLSINVADPSKELVLLSRKTAVIVGSLCCVLQSSSSGCKIIHDELLSNIDLWAGSLKHHHLIKFLVLLGTLFGTLHDAGNAIIHLLKPNNKEGESVSRQIVSTLKDFLQFVSSLDRLVNRALSSVTQLPDTAPTTRHRLTSNKIDTATFTLQNGKEMSRTCSYVETGEGFTEQHWYNCYTCGLIWEKGCCSLCVRVCHKGHDIGYSRKSSFFCDCGAEVAHAIEENRTPCRCLTPVSEDVIRSLYEEESRVVDESNSDLQAHEIPDNFIELLATSFLPECKKSLQTLVKEALRSEWRESIIRVLNQSNQGTRVCDNSLSKQLAIAAAANRPVTELECPNLQSRSGKPLSLKCLDTACMLPVRAAKASAIQTRIISGPSSLSSHARKSANSFHAQAISSDNRGRLFVAESSSVLFCSAIPSVNVRDIENSLNSHLSRSQLSILGSDSVKFPIIGLATNSENNRHLLVWGSTRACVAIVSKNLDSFERIIELKLNLDPSEECEFLIKCEWIPQSELHLVAICGAVVHVFDLKRTRNNLCTATTHYALAYDDVLIRSATFIGGLLVDDGSFIETRLALLLDTGKLHFIGLAIDEEGNLEDQGESYIEIGDGVSFPIGGIRRYCSGAGSPSGATATTFGEGLYLVHLKLANVLLYQCVSSCCIGMLLDDNGAVCGSFEFLPNTISSNDTGGHGGVTGPYTHFQELGVITRGSESFFRVSCVGRSTRSGPTALVLEFNEKSTLVREMSWPTSCSSGLGFISSYSFVGSCAFSCPHLVGNGTDERSYLTLLSSSGSILWFGEDCDLSPAGDRESSALSYVNRQVSAIGVFEQLINASELDGLIFGGDFARKDPKTIMKKLSLNNTDCVVCPAREGCTLTASLRLADESSLAIVAVRVLVGSMPDLVPREIIVMGSGRSIKLLKNMKRWYDFHLSEEEILLALRNGFVTIWISSCHDSSSASIIDSVEVYARARTEVQISNEVPSSQVTNRSFQMYPPSDSEIEECIQSLTHLTQLTGQNTIDSLSEVSAESISRVIQQTALECAENSSVQKLVLEFLDEAEANEENRTLFIDKATLRGLMTLLLELGMYLLDEFMNVDKLTPQQEEAVQRAIDMLVRILSSMIKIAQARPSNYFKVVSEMMDENLCQMSMALEGKRNIDFFLHLRAMFGGVIRVGRPIQIVSELMLIEIPRSMSDFAEFESLAEFLVSDYPEVIKACCSAVSNVILHTDVCTSNIIPSSERELSTMPVVYKCDSCLTFPITGQRYTLGGEMDIDLCKRCYDLGIEYSRSSDPTDPVIINGRTLRVENKDMACGMIWQMTSQPIAASSLEQAENAKKAGLLNNAANSTFLTGSSSQNVELSGSSMIDRVDGASEEFRSYLFTKLLSLVDGTFDSETNISPPSRDLVQLILDLVIGSCTEDTKTARGHEAALAFTKNVPCQIKECQTDESNPSMHFSKLIVSLRALTSLVLQDRDTKRDPTVGTTMEEEMDAAGTSHPISKDKTDPRFICEAHRVPAVRRRCSHGVHKDRRFYVCGLERSQRCNYFKWSSDVPASTPQFENESHSLDLFVSIQRDLQRIFSENDLHGGICDLVSKQFERYTAEQADGGVISERPSSASFPSIKTEMEKMQDKADGVYLTLEKLGKSKPVPTRSVDDVSSSVTDGSFSGSFLCSSLNLFSLIAPETNSSSWCSHWFPVLCEIISRNSIDASSTTSTAMRQRAKEMLLRLCGGRHEDYRRVRDHYVFGFQFRNLLQRSLAILDSALVVREQARQCGANWSEKEVNFEALPASGLLGVEDLISEDWYATSTEESIAASLDELLSSAERTGNDIKAQSNSWRIFCGLHGLQTVSHNQSLPSQKTEENFDSLEQVCHRPPIVALMWLSSCLRGLNQVKALSLIDIAIEDVNESKFDFQSENICHDDFYVGECQTFEHCSSDPEQHLMNAFNTNDLLAFINQFVLNGRSKELRSVSSSVARKLVIQLSASDKNHLFATMIGRSLQYIGSLGSTAKNISEFLRLCVCCFGSELALSSTAAIIAQAFSSQMTTLNQVLRCKTDTETGSLSCSLSDCVHCHRHILAKKAMKSSSKKADNSSANGLSNTCRANFLPEQVRSYQRSSIEASTAASVSSEFSSYHQLKFRVALSQVNVIVSEPRGRLVKSIGVYFSPRQVRDVNVLKSTQYIHRWQRCGTLSLARGASEATCKLKTPVIVANLRFSYEEFYDKASNRRAPDGSFILNCPRCTRQVQNAHGVCGNCGEVAFQCRKCRHINYDGLDAFLCVECGHCTSGAFNYELTAGLALNAIAVLDEDGFHRSMTMLRIASKRQVELRVSLRKKLSVATQQEKKLRGDQVLESLDELALYGPQLKRALLGGIPKFEGMDDEDESKKKSGSSRSKGSSSSAAERALSASSRARSLLNLARTLRAEGGDSLGTRGELLRQALLSAGGSSGTSGLESLDIADLLNALSSSGGGGNTSSNIDTLSRIVTNVHARTRDGGSSSTSRAASSGEGEVGASGDKSDKQNKSKLTPADERNRLYIQMREAERECYELNRRINAWTRLNEDRLKGTLSTPSTQSYYVSGDNNNSSNVFLPSTCSNCSLQITYDLLSLLHSIYSFTNNAQWEHTVTKNLIQLLLKESELTSIGGISSSPKHRELKDLKRHVLITLACTSGVGSKIILAELRSRLISVHDVTSAEVLGMLLELDFPFVDEYIELAMSTLSSFL